MSTAKHILLRIWSKKNDSDELIPTTATVIWTLEQWDTHRADLIEKYGDGVDERFVVSRGGLKRLKLLQQSLYRLEQAE